MKENLKKIQAVFYKTSTGNEPVREWLKSLNIEDKKIIGEDVKTVEFGFPIGMPICRSLGDKLWEVRSNLDNRISRIIFVVIDGQMILLHGFIKKTQATPKEDIDLARKRLKEIK